MPDDSFVGASILRIAGVVCLLVAAAAGAEEAVVFPDDPRIIEANALLEKEETWDRAVALYGEVLAEDPDHLHARLWTARVRAWQQRYDEALEHYRLLGLRADPPEDLFVERAEVLSWAGRYEEAEAAFRAILAEQPENARAAVGLARVLSWSGNKKEADDAYQRALALEDDAEVRLEQSKLRDAGTSRDGRSETTFFRDSDDFSLTRVGARGGMDLDLATRVLVSTAWTRAHIDRDPAAPTAALPETDRSIDGVLGLERRLARGLKGRVEAGGRWWDRADSRLLASGGLEYVQSDTTVWGLGVEYGDVLDRTHSLDAVLADINGTNLRGSLWKGLTDGVDAYWYAESAFLSDGNTRVAGGLSGGWKPFDFDLSLRPFASVLLYTDVEPLYYTPDLDVSGGLALAGSLPLHRTLTAEADLQVGGGYAEEGSLNGAGVTYRLEGGLAWRYAGWWVRLAGGWSRSQRSTVYRSTTAALTIGRGF